MGHPGKHQIDEAVAAGKGHRAHGAPDPILLQKKYSRVIECFAKQQGLSLDAALDFFYHSQVYQLIRDGVSDMHCMSDAYLAEELEQEYAGKVPVNVVVKDMI